MRRLYNHKLLKERRRELRKESTEEEIILWSILKKYLKEWRFRRQYSVGNFILDFYSPASRLGIELDGEYHENQKEYDQEREDFIKSKNIAVLRFKNSEVRNNLHEVTATIKKALFVCKP